MNLRGFGIFLFKNEKNDLGRAAFNEALTLELPNNDETKVLKIDTFLMLYDIEKEYGNEKNSISSLTNAMGVWSTIKNTQGKKEVHERIKRKLPKSD